MNKYIKMERLEIRGRDEQGCLQCQKMCIWFSTAWTKGLILFMFPCTH